MFSREGILPPDASCPAPDADGKAEEIARLQDALTCAAAVVIGAGAGLSASAGFVYDGPRFAQYFSDFAQKYGIRDMYSGGFFRFPSPETRWAFWSRMIWLNRYMRPPKPVYEALLRLVEGKDYFVITTNVDHCFQKAGFDKERLFYTQGDYGLFQCSVPCHAATYDNEDTVRRMVEAQGFSVGAEGALSLPAGMQPRMEVPAELVPRCPRCGAPMRMNLRADRTFVEDAGWHRAQERYAEFLRKHWEARVLYLELGVGYNTPSIIKHAFWQFTEQNPLAVYACVNSGEAACPKVLGEQAISIDGDIGAVVARLRSADAEPAE